MIIQGDRDSEGMAVVLVDGEPLPLEPSLAVWNHSPTGFNWGYGGSGPAQLALAILLVAGLTGEEASRLHQSFKWEHIAHLPADHFRLELDVAAWVAKHA